jgi:Ca2+-binding RTX toxin-like protein
VECRGRRATVVGTREADRLRGRPGREVFAGLAGDDIISQVGKDDVVCAGSGDDYVTSDVTKVMHSVWLIDLGAGDDRVSLARSTDVYGGPGDDRLRVEKGTSTLVGGPGDDVLRVTSTAVGRGSDGYAINTPCLDFDSAVRAVHVDLVSGRVRGQGRDTARGFRCVIGTRYGDVIRGSQLPDSLDGGAGPDLIIGRGGDDGASGGPGDDRIYSGDGVDYANGDDGRDRLYGQAGDDTLEGWTGSDYLEGDSGNDQVYGAIYCAIGGNSYDTGGKLDGAPDELFGNDGDDYLVGDKGNDRLDGGAGYDWAQPGVHDRRIDWVEHVEDYVNGCLENVTMAEPLIPSEVRDIHPW